MIAENWLVYLFMIVFLLPMLWLVAKIKGQRLRLRRVLIQSAAACVGLTAYYLILAN